jgi:hypothetical protein
MGRLALRHLGSRRLALSIPLRVRLLPALVSGWLIYVLAGAVDIPGGLPRTAALVVFGLSVAAALFDDRWVFDLDQKKVVHRLGLLFAARETAVGMESLSAVVLDPGPARDGRATLALREQDGRLLRLERVRGDRAGELRPVAVEISAFCGIPLQDGTP